MRTNKHFHQMLRIDCHPASMNNRSSTDPSRSCHHYFCISSHRQSMRSRSRVLGLGMGQEMDWAAVQNILVVLVP